MGYVLPAPPTRPSPTQASAGPRDFGQQLAGNPIKWMRPSSPYQGYLFDLYGPSGHNWLPVINAGIIVSAIALVVVAVGAVAAGW